jgi:hypothetical protein
MVADNADLEQKIIDAVYRGACDQTGLERAIELIAQYFDSGGAVLAEFDYAAPEAQLTIGARTIDNTFFVNYADYAAFDPAPRAFAAMPVETVSTTDRMFSRETLRADVFLNEFLLPRDVDAAVGGPLLSAGGRFALVAVHQATNRRRFGDDDIARLERLTPHLTRALQIRRLFLQSEWRGRVLESIINRSRTGMIGLSGDGPALFVNAAAQAVAAARDGIGLDRDGHLVISDRTAAKRLTALETDVARGGAGGLMRIPRLSGRVSYVVLVSPLPSGDEVLPKARSGILIAIHDPSRRMASAAQRIAHILHVPPGAAKVVEAMLEGIELKDYAGRAGVSMNTIKFHLKTTFARTESRNQADLVRKAMMALSDLGPYFSE